MVSLLVGGVGFVLAFILFALTYTPCLKKHVLKTLDIATHIIVGACVSIGLYAYGSFSGATKMCVVPPEED